MPAIDPACTAGCDLKDAECYVIPATNGADVHLWWKICDGGQVFSWLAESDLPAVVFTPGEARQLLDVWKFFDRYLRRGQHTDIERSVSPLTAYGHKRTSLVFGLRDGHLTYRRDGETQDDMNFNVHAMQELIPTWQEVCDEARRAASV
ncbi:MAG: hypothetical protein M3443_08035 [Actinomycetota bacterium]|nr:hypothetical protein [Actinomycetota bacterium]